MFKFVSIKINFVFLFLILSPTALALENVWIDYDISFGRYYQEVDDGFALISAVSSPGLNIQGISYGFGNSNDLKFMQKQTQKILSIMGRTDIQTFPGARHRLDLGQQTPATEAMHKALQKSPLKILAMGRMTNLASLILLHPEVIPNIKEVIVNYGRRLEYETGIGAKNIIMPDTNVDGDVEAIKVLLAHQIPLTLIPVELMHDQFILKDDLIKLKHGGLVAHWMRKQSLAWKYLWQVFLDLPGFIPWDVFIVGYMTNPQDFKCLRNIPIALKTMPNHAVRLPGFNNDSHKDTVVASPLMDRGIRGTYCYEVDQNHLNSWVDHWTKL